LKGNEMSDELKKDEQEYRQKITTALMIFAVLAFIASSGMVFAGQGTASLYFFILAVGLLIVSAKRH
jgi:hypothetical protein